MPFASVNSTRAGAFSFKRPALSEVEVVRSERERAGLMEFVRLVQYLKKELSKDRFRLGGMVLSCQRCGGTESRGSCEFRPLVFD